MTQPATRANIRQELHESDQLSAFLDGEVGQDEAKNILRHLSGNLEQQRSLREYMAVGDALRGLHGGPGFPHLTERVMSALEDEPTVLAPMRHSQDRRPAMWLAAAAVGAISWGLWSSLPDTEAPIPMAANTAPVGAVAQTDVQPYLAAHQDFAQAVIAPAEMNFTQVSLMEPRP